jgi:hypothetical protein
MAARGRLATAALAAWLANSGCGGGYDPSGPTFTLLYTGAVGGNLEPCG